ncbi:MAG: peptidoglycan DD-metalloendopeptidase family protein [Sulfurovum sp.]|nr:peptidoglycan DD-metalloendopeptidase family protein [Sulfurovum sp.]
MRVNYQQWEKGKTFSDYLDAHNIPRSLLQSISEEDKKFLLEIRSGYKYYELLDNDGEIDQALIPISEEMQIHIFRKHHSQEYGFDIIPIVYRNKEYFGKIEISSNPYSDALKATNYPQVAKRLSMALKGVVNTKKLHKGDEISFVYMQKTRLGELYAMPKIKIIKVQMGEKTQYVYVDEEGYGYSEVSKKVAYTVTGKKKVVYTRRVSSSKGKRFGMPLRHARITSSFSYRRWHPILHRYRPHHGTDFGARRGTPLLAVNDGKVIFAGWMGGYGRVVKIKHAGGYISLYAHQSRIRVKRGQHVTRGQIIGYVGSSGRSTGPHLHFGLMKNGRWIDPMKVLRKKSAAGTILKKFTKYEDIKTTKYRKIEIKGAEESRKKLDAYLINDASSYIWGKERFKIRLQDEEVIENEE